MGNVREDVLVAKVLGKSRPLGSAQRIEFFNIGSGRVLDKIPGSGSGRSVEKYDRVFPGMFFTFGYFRVFRVFPGMSGIFGYFWVYPYILGLFSNIQ